MKKKGINEAVKTSSDKNRECFSVEKRNYFQERADVLSALCESEGRKALKTSS